MRDWTVQLGGGVEYHHSSTVLVRDYASGKTAAEIKEARAAPVAWSADGRFLAAGENGPAGRVGVWDVRTGARSGRIVSHVDVVTHAAFTPENDLVTLSRDGTLRISNPRTSRTASRLEISADSMASGPRALAVSPDGTTIVAVWGATVHVWTPRGNSLTSYNLSSVRKTEGWPLCISPDCRWMACRTEDGFDIMDVASGELLYWQTSDVVVTAGAFATDGGDALLVLGKMNGVVEVWDIGVKTI